MATNSQTEIEGTRFVEFRGKVRSAEVLSAAMEHRLGSLRFTGGVSVVVHNGRVLKSGYEGDIFVKVPNRLCSKYRACTYN